MSDHRVKLCKNCNAVIEQCRCPDENKRVEYGICAKCDKGTIIGSGETLLAESEKREAKLRKDSEQLRRALILEAETHEIFKKAHFELLHDAQELADKAYQPNIPPSAYYKAKDFLAKYPLSPKGEK